MNIFSNNKKDKGFTLIEIMVAVSLFAIVMTISMGAILSIVNSNRKAQSLKSVMNNLNFAIENMTRVVKTGSGYSYGASTVCPGTTITENNKLQVGNAVIDGSPGHIVEYSLNETGQIVKTVDGTPSTVTAPEVTIERLCFYIDGQNAGDGKQPKVIMVLEGVAGVNEKTRSRFNLQTTISERLSDS